MSYINQSFSTHTNIIKKHTDINGNLIVESIDGEVKQVCNSHVVLEQIPHSLMNMEVSLINYIQTTDDVMDASYSLMNMVNDNVIVLQEDEYKVDYNEGKVWVNANLEGKYLSINYWGIGHSLIHLSRVYTSLDDKGNVVETLEMLIDEGYKALKFIGDYPTALEEGKVIVSIINNAATLREDIQKLIENGTLLENDLLQANNTARTYLDTLAQLIPESEVLRSDLSSLIEEGTILNNNLSETVESGSELLVKTAGANQTLIYLREAITNSDNLVNELNKHDNMIATFKISNWSDNNTISWTHNLNSVSLIIAFYDNEDRKIDLDYKIENNNQITFTHHTPIEFKAVVNIAYRGVDGSLGSGSMLSQTQLLNINTIPTLQAEIVDLKDKNTTLTSRVGLIETKHLEDITNLEDRIDNIDTNLLSRVQQASNDNSCKINASSFYKKGVDRYLGLWRNYTDGSTEYDRAMCLYDENGTIDISSPIRTTKGGILPHYRDGGCAIGSTTSRFNQGYINNIFTVNGGVSVGGRCIFISPSQPSNAKKGDIWIKSV